MAIQVYLSKLAQLEGKAEFTLKLTPVAFPELEIAPEVKGKDYFLAQKQPYQAQLSYQKQQQEAMSQSEQAMAQTYSHHYLRLDEVGDKTLYLLVARDRKGQLCHHVQPLQQQCPQWKLNLGEALPPYHCDRSNFVTSSQGIQSGSGRSTEHLCLGNCSSTRSKRRLSEQR